MSRVGAVAAMVSGLCVSFYYIVANHPWVQLYFDVQPSDTLWWGLEPICAGVFGVPTGLLVGFVFSKRWPEKN
jgi:cation/acetate symporter